MQALAIAAQCMLPSRRQAVRLAALLHDADDSCLAWIIDCHVVPLHLFPSPAVSTFTLRPLQLALEFPQGKLFKTDVEADLRADLSIAD